MKSDKASSDALLPISKNKENCEVGKKKKRRILRSHQTRAFIETDVVKDTTGIGKKDKRLLHSPGNGDEMSSKSKENLPEDSNSKEKTTAVKDKPSHVKLEGYFRKRSRSSFEKKVWILNKDIISLIIIICF